MRTTKRWVCRGKASWSLTATSTLRSRVTGSDTVTSQSASRPAAQASATTARCSNRARCENRLTGDEKPGSWRSARPLSTHSAQPGLSCGASTAGWQAPSTASRVFTLPADAPVASASRGGGVGPAQRLGQQVEVAGLVHPQGGAPADGERQRRGGGRGHGRGRLDRRRGRIDRRGCWLDRRRVAGGCARQREGGQQHGDRHGRSREWGRLAYSAGSPTARPRKVASSWSAAAVGGSVPFTTARSSSPTWADTRGCRRSASRSRSSSRSHIHRSA